MSAWIRAELIGRRRLLAALGAGGFAFMVLMGLSYRALGRDTLGQAFGNGHVPGVFQALSGSRTGNILSPHGWMGFGFNHPVFLTVTMAVALSIGAGSVAGEVESGRGEMIFTRPVSRTRFYFSGVLMWAAAEAAVTTVVTAGALTGALLSPDVRRAGVSALVLAPLQYLPLALLVAAVAFLASTLARTRGSALAWAIGFVVFGYMLNFIAGLVDGFGWARWLSPFAYYDPGIAVTNGVQWAPAAGLTAAALVILLVGRALFERRDLA